MTARARSLEDRFWDRVDKRGVDECWPWKLKPGSRGYASLYWREDGKLRRIRAHRLAWEIANQSGFPDGLVARHTCDNPLCCNPRHIVPGTVADNNQDAVERGRQNNIAKTHCSRGHPLSGDNLILRKGGWRACKICQRAAQYRWKRERQA